MGRRRVGYEDQSEVLQHTDQQRTRNKEGKPKKIALSGAGRLTNGGEGKLINARDHRRSSSTLDDNRDDDDDSIFRPRST
jgi:hypothetical protein